MPLVETLPVGADAAQWSLWSTTLRLVVSDPATLPRARVCVAEVTAAVEAACSRFRADSELSRLSVDGRPVRVSALLGQLVEAGLRAAARTDGDVDPTLGTSMAAAGYDRTFALVGDGPHRVLVPVAEAWRRIELSAAPGDPGGRLLSVPAGVRLDLGATAKAVAADLAAAAVVAELGGGVMVAIGGDIATAGVVPGPSQGWTVLVRDDPRDGECLIRLDAGGAIATSSTAARTWTRQQEPMHHIFDPRTGAPAVPVWRTVSVAAGTCEEANTLSTAAVVRGPAAVAWLRSFGVPARLVAADGHIVTLGGWP